MLNIWHRFSPQQVLNCTLDDIEVFMSQLQKAAEAFSQLNHRNKSKKNKKKGPAGLSPFLLLQWNEGFERTLVRLTRSFCLFVPFDLDPPLAVHVRYCRRF